MAAAPKLSPPFEFPPLLFTYDPDLAWDKGGLVYEVFGSTRPQPGVRRSIGHRAAMRTLFVASER
jgi:hypothetical protein